MGALFGGAPQPSAPIIQAPPTPIAPAPMPVPDPDAQRMAAEKQMAAAAGNATTRKSTIIGNDDTLG